MYSVECDDIRNLLHTWLLVQLIISQSPIRNQLYHRNFFSCGKQILQVIIFSKPAYMRLGIIKMHAYIIRLILSL